MQAGQTTTELEPLGRVIRRTAVALGGLVEDHVELASVELERDTRGLTRDMVMTAASLPVVGVGYVFLCGALTQALAPTIGLAWSAFAVGLANVLLGAGLGWAGMSGLRKRTWLDKTRAQIRQSFRAIVDALDDDGPSPVLPPDPS